MAVIRNLKLFKPKHDARAQIVVLRVTYEVGLWVIERNMTGLRFKETIQIWGKDYGDDPDDFLYQFPTEKFKTETDGLVERDRTVTIADDILDEDRRTGDVDEIFARVWVKPLLPRKAYLASNVERAEFKT